MTKIFNSDFSSDALQVLGWQDSNSPNFLSVVHGHKKITDKLKKDFLDSWLKDVYTLETANEFGLKVWSIILNVPLFGTNTPSDLNYPAFGFDRDTTGGAPNSGNFDNSNFATDTNSQYRLTVEEKRQILKLRYYNLVSRGNSFETNRFLQDVFGNGIIHVANNQDMTIDVVITGSISQEVIYVTGTETTTRAFTGAYFSGTDLVFSVDLKMDLSLIHI